MADAKLVTAISNALRKHADLIVSSSQASQIADSIVAEAGSMKFFALPDAAYAEIDTEKVLNSVITVYEGIMKVTLYPADPVRLFLTTLATIIAQQNAVSDYMSKQNLVHYAVGIYLDHLAAFLNVYRLDEFPAKTILKFSMQTERPIATVVPQGTRVTADGKMFFATDEALLIPAGSLDGEIAATCLTHGVAGNGLAKKQISKIVDLVPYVSEAENINQTSGGSDVEDDESLRLRIRLAPEGFSTAGSELSYVFFALGAHSNIGDVSVVTPLPGHVHIFVMLKGGKIPDEDSAEIMAVWQKVGMNPSYYDDNPYKLQATKHRPLNDMVAVLPIHHEPIDYVVKWFVTNSQAMLFKEISGRVAEAIKKYEDWQIEQAGRDINPDKLRSLCQAAGAKRVELEGLDFTEIDKSSVANFIENADRIVFGGIEGE